MILKRCLVRFAGALLLIGGVAACGPGPSSRIRAPTSSQHPCQFLTEADAVQITRDAGVTSQAVNVTETPSGYVACVFADPKDEANTVAVQIKRTPRGVSASDLSAAVTYFSLGEPVEPFQPFAVSGIGDNALGEELPTGGVAFVVFSKGNALAYVGAGSGSVGIRSLRAGVETLAQRVAADL